MFRSTTKHSIQKLSVEVSDEIGLYKQPEIFWEVSFMTEHVDFEDIIKMIWKLGARRYVTELCRSVAG